MPSARSVRSGAVRALSERLWWSTPNVRFVLLVLVEFLYNAWRWLTAARPSAAKIAEDCSAAGAPPVPLPIVVVTGATSGVGRELVRALFGRAELHLPVRDMDKGEALRRELTGAAPAEKPHAGSAKSVEKLVGHKPSYADVAFANVATPPPDAHMHLYTCDLESSASVMAFVSVLQRTLPPGRKVDLLVLNAGNYAGSFQTCAADAGVERMFAVHVLAAHVLLRELSDRPGVRTVLATSSSAAWAVHQRDPVAPYGVETKASWPLGAANSRASFSRFGSYSAAKALALGLLAEHAASHPDVRVEAVHPGMVATGITAGDTWASTLVDGVLAPVLGRLALCTPDEGAATLVWRAFVLLGQADARETPEQSDKTVRQRTSARNKTASAEQGAPNAVRFFHDMAEAPIDSQSLKALMARAAAKDDGWCVSAMCDGVLDALERPARRR